jgi:hypothetical protein
LPALSGPDLIKLNVELTPKNLKLVGITLLLIASKYEEMLMLSIDNLSGIFSADDIRGMEIKIVWALDFCLRWPLSLNFLWHNSKASSVSTEHHNLAKLAMEFALTEYWLAHILPMVNNKMEPSNQNKPMAAGNTGAIPKRADDRVDPKKDERSVKSKTKVDKEEVVIGIEATAPSSLQ